MNINGSASDGAGFLIMSLSMLEEIKGLERYKAEEHALLLIIKKKSSSHKKI